MNKKAKTWLKNSLRWGVAVFGIWYVLNNMSWSDRVLVAGPDGWPTAMRLATPAPDNATSFQVRQPDGSIRTMGADEVLARVDSARVQVSEQGVQTEYDLLAQRVQPQKDQSQWHFIASRPRSLWQRYWNHHTSEIRDIAPAQIIGQRPSSLPYPLVDRGIGPMLHAANTSLLLAAIFVFPVVFFIVSYRWLQLLRAIQIRMTFWQAFRLNMVGAFYNTFMPGSTGGDLLKAYYASKLTPHRTRAVMSVIIDRVIGLLALVFLGGVMCTVGLFLFPPSDPARRKCSQIAIASLLIILGTAVGLLFFYSPILRRVSGLDWIIRRLPMQKQVQHAIETMEIYKRRPVLMLLAILVTLPVHSTVVVSAMFAGMAFNLPLDRLYYWVIVPVIVLVASIPISPQGVGVMEFFAILLTKRQGCTVSQAFALTMSIRIVQILWNLTGGLFVLQGGFHTPTDQEKHTMDDDAAG